MSRMHSFLPLFVVVVALIGHAEIESPKATIRNLANVTEDCTEGTSIVAHDDGRVEISFRDIIASRAHSVPFRKCQIHGEIVIPAGYGVVATQFADADFGTHFSKPGDQSGGRFRLEFDDAISSSIAMNKAQPQLSESTLTLKNALPTLHGCETDRVVPLRITVEAMINYRLDEVSEVSSRLNAVRIPSLNLAPISCRGEAL